MEQQPTGNSRLDLFLYIQSYLTIGATAFLTMEFLLKLALMGTGILLNLVGLIKMVRELKSKKTKNGANSKK